MLLTHNSINNFKITTSLSPLLLLLLLFITFSLLLSPSSSSSLSSNSNTLFLEPLSPPQPPHTTPFHHRYYYHCNSFPSKYPPSICHDSQFRQYLHFSPPPPPPPNDEIDPRYGVEKRLVPSGPNPLHN